MEVITILEHRYPLSGGDLRQPGDRYEADERDLKILTEATKWCRVADNQTAPATVAVSEPAKRRYQRKDMTPE